MRPYLPHSLIPFNENALSTSRIWGEKIRAWEARFSVGPNKEMYAL